MHRHDVVTASHSVVSVTKSVTLRMAAAQQQPGNSSSTCSFLNCLLILFLTTSSYPLGTTAQHHTSDQSQLLLLYCSLDPVTHTHTNRAAAAQHTLSVNRSFLNNGSSSSSRNSNSTSDTQQHRGTAPCRYLAAGVVFLPLVAGRPSQELARQPHLARSSM